MRILDLFCGAGGAAWGIHQALPDAEIVGVDCRPQPHYPFAFVQADAMTYPLEGFDFVWASPPCQAYSAMTACRPGLSSAYPDLIAPTRKRLWHSGAPWVIENVRGAPLIGAMMLCGQQFGLDLYRHRYFEGSFFVLNNPHPRHIKPGSRAGHYRAGTVISVSGHSAPIRLAEKAMGIGWMNREELAEAIPPAYSRYILSAMFPAAVRESAAARSERSGR